MQVGWCWEVISEAQGKEVLPTALREHSTDFFIADAKENIQTL